MGYFKEASEILIREPTDPRMPAGLVFGYLKISLFQPSKDESVI